jgi:hypothetical protein
MNDIMFTPPCGKSFDINCRNSDANCHRKSPNWAKKLARENPDICKECVYLPEKEMINLNKGQMFNNLTEDCPEAMNFFSHWLIGYQEANAYVFSFHNLPMAMQLGLIQLFLRDVGANCIGMAEKIFAPGVLLSEIEKEIKSAFDLVQVIVKSNLEYLKKNESYVKEVSRAIRKRKD